MTVVSLVGACGDDGGGGGSGTSDSAGTDGTTSDTTAGTDTTDGTTTATTNGTGGTSTTDPTATTTDTTNGGTDSATTGGTGASDVFRFTEIYVRDPHFYVDVMIIGCTDITDSVPLNAAPSVNQQFNDAMSMDMSGGPNDEPDGYADLSFLLGFDPLDQAGAGGDVDFIDGDCTLPLDTTTCMQRPDTTVSPGTYTNDAANTCLSPTASEQTDMYSPEPNTVAPSCFLGAMDTVTLGLGDLVLPLTDVQVSASYMGDPADNLITGLMRGFLSQADADAAVLPQELQDQAGVMYVSGLLPGGTGNCAGHDDMDDNNGTPGWWMYVDFAATRVDYQ